MKYEFDLAVYIGRFQPFHRGHLDTLNKARKIAKNVLVLIGSSDAAPSVKNPWNWAERAEMIEVNLPEDQTKVKCRPIRDYFYNELAWTMEVQNIVSSYSHAPERIAIVGQYKDASSYYINQFRDQWSFVQPQHSLRISATDVRDAMFSAESLPVWRDKSVEWCGMVPKPVYEYLAEWLKTDQGQAIKAEYQRIKKYKAQWANAPYPPTFVTADAVVVKTGHVLVVRRKFFPGKGQLAIPGGFVKPGELIADAAIRELREETRIQVPAAALKRNVVEQKVFDYPDRDPRGRTITHAHLIDLGYEGDLPHVRGDDDAEGAFWIPIRDVLEEPREFFADHAQILYQFIMNRTWR